MSFAVHICYYDCIILTKSLFISLRMQHTVAVITMLL